MVVPVHRTSVRYFDEQNDRVERASAPYFRFHRASSWRTGAGTVSGNLARKTPYLPSPYTYRTVVTGLCRQQKPAGQDRRAVAALHACKRTLSISANALFADTRNVRLTFAGMPLSYILLRNGQIRPCE